ncbi:MAG: NlpC/P60 family protein [Clostridium sp.]|uniref:C40 family peptidase n=1 Tax=Clostridium sp. TaxID=1506 RepID=UPI003061B481
MRRIRVNRRGEKRRTAIKFLCFICVFTIVFMMCNAILDDTYEKEKRKMSKEDIEIVNEVIQLARDSVGLEYVWGGKGEIMTEERLEELVSYYGNEYYPLDKAEYIGKQAFDCSGLTFWTYKSVTDVFIGYSTTEQEKILKDYKVSNKDIQPGDIIFTPGHVVMYVGDGKIINSANKKAYPEGGVKEEGLWLYRFGQVYRPIDYVKDCRK